MENFKLSNGMVVRGIDGDNEVGIEVECAQTVYLTFEDIVEMLELYKGALT